MTNWKDKVGKFIVIEEQEIASDMLFMVSMSNRYSYGVFKILPYREEVFPEVNYKVVLEPCWCGDRFRKRAYYIMDLESSMRPNCFNPEPKACIFNSKATAVRYANNLNKEKKNER